MLFFSVCAQSNSSDDTAKSEAARYGSYFICLIIEWIQCWDVQLWNI